METQSSKNQLKEKWLTTEELLKYLKDNGYPATLGSLTRWEKANIIPQPQRVRIFNTDWRVYSKDGADFEKILDSLQSRTKKRVTL